MADTRSSTYFITREWVRVIEQRARSDAPYLVLCASMPVGRAPMDRGTPRPATPRSRPSCQGLSPEILFQP